tara:strand:- start:1250 stop:1624 length:375 start_codon:yes stop_codon:yes gene_type:complete
MAITTGKLSITETDYMFIDTASTATAVTDVFGGSATIHSINMVNGHSNPAWLKIYNASSATVGTTDPDIILKADGSGTNGGRTVWQIIDGIALTNMTYASEISAGTSGTSNPDAGNLTISMVVR